MLKKEDYYVTFWHDEKPTLPLPVKEEIQRFLSSHPESVVLTVWEKALLLVEELPDLCLSIVVQKSLLAIIRCYMRRTYLDLNSEGSALKARTMHYYTRMLTGQEPSEEERKKEMVYWTELEDHSSVTSQ